MKKFVLAIISIATFIGSGNSQTNASKQTATGKLKFQQGQTVHIAVKVKTTVTQQVQGQALDFNVDATGEHSYKITNATEDNNTLHHKVDHISFVFDGMGTKRSFNSAEEKDMNGPLGKPIKSMLEKTYDMIIDSNGKVLMTLPEKMPETETDSRMAIITAMMKEISDVALPPQKGKASMFKILPDTIVSKGDGWTESWENDKGKFDVAYAISDINDSTIVVDFAGTSNTISKAEMMGSETTTKLSSKFTGKIILDRITGVMREKTTNTESTGTTESSFGNLPVTSKTTTTVTVKTE